MELETEEKNDFCKATVLQLRQRAQIMSRIPSRFDIETIKTHNKIFSGVFSDLKLSKIEGFKQLVFRRAGLQKHGHCISALEMYRYLQQGTRWKVVVTKKERLPFAIVFSTLGYALLEAKTLKKDTTHLLYSLGGT